MTDRPEVAGQQDDQGRQALSLISRFSFPVSRSSSLLAFSIGLFLISLLLRLLWIGQPIVVDSVEWLRRGARFLLALQAGDWANTYGSAHPGVTNLWLIAAGLAGRSAVLGEPIPTLEITVLPRDAYPSLDYYIAARIPFAVVTSLCTVLIYRWASRVHGREIALMAAVLLALEPFWLGYNRVITTDALQGNLMTLSLLAFLCYLDGHGRRWVIISGILGGLAIITKLPALILWPVVASWAVLRRWAIDDKRRSKDNGQWRTLGVVLVGWVMLAVLTAVALWPALWVDSISVVQKINAQITQVELGERHQFFLGQTVDAPGPAFYPLALLFRTSPVTLLAVLGTLVAMAVSAARQRIHRPGLIAAWLIFLVALMAGLTMAETKFDRYLIPAYPALALIAATGIHALARCLSSITYRPLSRLARHPSATAQLLLAIAQAAFLLSVFPDLQAFYSPLAGGASVARQILMIGNGEGLDQAGKWLSAQDGSAHQMAAAWYPSVLDPYFAGRTMELNQQLPDGFWPWAMAHYVVLYVNQVQRSLPAPQVIRYFREQPAEFTVRLAGIDYAWVYPGPMVPPGPLPTDVIPLDAVFEGQIRLLGWEPPADPLLAGRGNLRLYWEVLKPPVPDLSVFVGLRDSAGRIWGRHDRPPVDGFLPLDRWLPGMRIRDAQAVSAFPGTPPGTYELEIALFSPSLGRNLTITASDGAPLGDRLRLGHVTIGPEPVPADPKRLEIRQRLDLAAGDITLLGLSYEADELPDGAPWPLVLWWQAGEKQRLTAVAPSHAFNVRLILQDAQGQTWERPSTHPIGGAYSPERWPPRAIVRDIWNALLPPGLSDGLYQAFLVIQDEAGREVARASAGTIRVRGRPHTFIVPSMQLRLDVNLSNQVILLGCDLTDEAGRPARRWKAGETYLVTLYWQPLRTWDVSHIGFVHMLDADRTVVAQRDQVPGEGQFPTTGWLPGEVLADRYRLTIPPDLPAGVYLLEAGLYRPDSLERLLVLDATGSPTADHVMLGEIAVGETP
ncbi:MAG: glycosyltransferase family 39 protein [Anaerolineae bacterium]|nr:glycosyltransferase family 39 protein [Anaerolineae bacterium]MDW8098666.1 glycosyltransferase family 39 protein [Anaerolineae bacterium]